MYIYAYLQYNMCIYTYTYMIHLDMCNHVHIYNIVYKYYIYICTINVCALNNMHLTTSNIYIYIPPFKGGGGGVKN